MEYIDVTPTWASLWPIAVEMLRSFDPTTEPYKIWYNEILRALTHLDKINESNKQ